MPEYNQKEPSALIRILHLDDDPDDINIFASILDVLDPVGYVVTSVSSLEDARRALSRESFDIIVADHLLDQTEFGGTSSPLLLDVLTLSSYLPILMTTAQMHIPVSLELQKYLDGGRVRLVSKDMMTVRGVETEIQRQLSNSYSVLVIDDDKDDYDLVADILSQSEKRNFHIRYAATLTEARESLLAHSFDIILCDWRLGAEDSADFIIEAADMHPELCIVLITGYDPVDLPMEVYRLFGHRRIAFHSKSLLHTAEDFEKFVISQMNRLVGTQYIPPDGDEQHSQATAEEVPPLDHPDENLRQQALDETGLVYSPAQRRFDVITAAAKNAFQVPIVLISLVHHGKQWFKSAQGIAAAETERCISFCGHAILQREIFEIPDAAENPLFQSNPLVTGPPNIRFYAGLPVRSATGFPLGTLCLIDTRPRQLDVFDRRRLRALGKWLETEVENCGITESAMERVAEEYGGLKELQLDEHTKCWKRAVGELLLARLLEEAKVKHQPATVGVLQLRCDSFLTDLPPDQLAEVRLHFANVVRMAFSQAVVFFAEPPDLIYFMNSEPGLLEILPDMATLQLELNAKVCSAGHAIHLSVAGVVCHKLNADGRQKKNIIDRLKRDVNQTAQAGLREIPSW